MNLIDFQHYSDTCRNAIKDGNRFLITEVGTSPQDKERLNVNCDGFGRIRLFQRFKDADWIENPLPFNPYAKAMSINVSDILPVQVFQLAKCNMNCWWCFLPDEFKVCDMQHCKWFTVQQLVEMYLRTSDAPPKIIDLSGGNPELAPEFVLLFMRELERLGQNHKVYLWSDDVLTVDYMFRCLQLEDIAYMANYRQYGKVACFKGIDDASFCFNTCSTLSLLSTQLELAERYIRAGFDIYFYVPLTCPTMDNIQKNVTVLFDKLQRISYYLPLRIVPIKIKQFSTNQHRLSPFRMQSLENQFHVLEIWEEEKRRRFQPDEISMDIADVPLL